MFGGGGKNWTTKIMDRINTAIDKRLEEFRGQIAFDVSKGIGTIAGLIAIWTVAVICTLFFGITLALLISWLLSSWLSGGLAYMLGFLIISLLIGAASAVVLLNKEKWIEKPVFDQVGNDLRSSFVLLENKDAERPNLFDKEKKPDFNDDQKKPKEKEKKSKNKEPEVIKAEVVENPKTKQDNPISKQLPPPPNIDLSGKQ